MLTLISACRNTFVSSECVWFKPVSLSPDEGRELLTWSRETKEGILGNNENYDDFCDEGDKLQ